MGVRGFLAVARQKILRDHRELERGAAAEEEDVMRVGDTEQLAHEGEGFGVDAVDGLGAVAHLDERHALTLVVDEVVAGGLEGLERERAWAGGEVEDAAGGRVGGHL